MNRRKENKPSQSREDDIHGSGAGNAGGGPISRFGKDTPDRVQIPLAGSPISAGFPSPADDYLDSGIDLNRELIQNPDATFFGRVRGFSMIDAGISDGDVLVVDKSLEPREGAVAVCFIDGEFTVKRIRLGKGCLYLMPENEGFQPLKVTADNDFMVWGIVTYVIKKMTGSGR